MPTETVKPERDPTVSVRVAIYARLKKQLDLRGQTMVFVVSDVLDKVAQFLEKQKPGEKGPFIVSVVRPKLK